MKNAKASLPQKKMSAKARFLKKLQQMNTIEQLRWEKPNLWSGVWKKTSDTKHF